MHQGNKQCQAIQVTGLAAFPIIARINRYIGSAEFNRIERVTGGLLNFNVSGDCRDRDNTDFGSSRAMMRATASSEAVSVSIRKARATRV